MAKTEEFTPIPLQPLSQPLDTRSRPAELAPGAMRYKLNWACNRTGQLTTRPGFSALDLGDGPNWDYHRRGGVREPVTLLLEATKSDNTRTLFAGTQSTMAWLDNDTGEWTEIAAGLGADGSRFKAATLSDVVVFGNGVDDPRSHDLGTATSEVLSELVAQIAGLASEGATSQVKLVIEYQGVVLWFGDQFAIWSDYRKPKSYTPAAESVAGFQFLDGTGNILNVTELLGTLYVFTERAIYRVGVDTNADKIFSFTKFYSETKNQAGCLAYANSVVSNGTALFWWSRDSIWTYNPYIAAPTCSGDSEWLMRCSGHVFSDTNADRVDRRCCNSVVAEYHPDTKEVWFSYPVGTVNATPTCVNNRCLVLSTEYKTADIVDHGFTALVNFRPSSDSAQVCNATQLFIGASGSDYSLKSIGDVFYREMVTLIGSDVATDIPDASYALTKQGYYRRLVGQCPFGYPQRTKTLNKVVFQHDTKAAADVGLSSPNLIGLRIGNSEHLTDPMQPDGNCSTQWHTQEDVPLVCFDTEAMSKLEAQGMRPSDDTEANVHEQGKYLFYDVLIKSATGAAPVGSDSAWASLTFSVKTN